MVLLGFAVGLFFWTRPAPSQASAAAASAATPTGPVSAVPQYGTCKASSDGIGKTYHGREISHVMGHPGIGWLERTEREKEEAPSKAIAALKLAPDAVVADIGAGSGYYTFRLAPLVPQGRVVAIDIQPEMLAYMNEEMRARGVKNVQPHLGSVTELKLPDASLDAVLMVDAYHEFDHPAEMLISIKAALKKGGRIYLVEIPRRRSQGTHQAASQDVRGPGSERTRSRRLPPSSRTVPTYRGSHLMVFEKP
ncbi:hypothetical protein EMGBS8_11000 [Verrucomicrobiota bacterium]|nr:hypothetical protein EMGBS8_11000 [Verrucomicrobiota bacterium]